MKPLRLVFLSLLTSLASLFLHHTGAVAQGAFDEAAFCAAAKDAAQKMNQESPMMVDNLTRQDGMAVVCAARMVDFKKSILVKQSDFREGWLERKQAQWNELYCPNEIMGPAIRAGWTVQMTLTFASGERYRISAKCG